MVVIIIFFFFISITSISNFSTAVDTLATDQTLSDDGRTTLVSASQTFVLGFFSPGTSRNRYLGIWFRNVPEPVVWVANNNNPLSDSSGVLRLTPMGDLIISYRNQASLVWKSNSSSPGIKNPVLQLLDNGNLVVKNGDSFVWQSFDYPGDTVIAGMKLGWNLKTKTEWYIKSWRSENDPSTGDFSFKYGLEILGLPTLVLRKGSVVQFRSGPWNGRGFGQYSFADDYMGVFKPSFVYNDENAYFMFQCLENSTILRFMVNKTGLITLYMWSLTKNGWIDLATMQVDHCDTYELCGNNSLCNINSPRTCECLDGFKPKYPPEWEALQWSSGCVRRKPLNCSEPQGFRKFSGIKLPQNSRMFGNRTTMSSADCEEACLSNCSCSAYVWAEGVGCAVWYGDLQDMRSYYSEGQDLYVRMPASELLSPGSSKNGRRRRALIASVSVFSGLLLLAIITCYGLYTLAATRKRRVIGADRTEKLNQESPQKIGEEDLELPLFDFKDISSATCDFSSANKIGAGGFGTVYKGLDATTGQEIAVKRLSKDSGQGLNEFKNEVILIAKLQHRNLVRLLGCCIHEEEKILIYEYMPNNSLELFIFDQKRRATLGWKTRFDIIVGIARGLLYLHRDSRLRIIHRDLKASNILLDSEMNSKISDFGLAKTFNGDQQQDNTNRIMGTHGYMSPEYAVHGLFSVKSDVFSFGVLVLEIISGKKNREFYHPDHDLNLLGHAWKLWNEGNAIGLVDEYMHNLEPDEVLRCIQLGLLCVQQRPEDRPTMSAAVLILDSENPLLPQPKQPGFYSERSVIDANFPSSTGNKVVSNGITVTSLQGR